MTKIFIDKNFRPLKDDRREKIVFKPSVRKSAISKEVNVSHFLRTAKPIIRKHQ
jgi:hypothetical protein